MYVCNNSLTLYTTRKLLKLWTLSSAIIFCDFDSPNHTKTHLQIVAFSDVILTSLVVSIMTCKNTDKRGQSTTGHVTFYETCYQTP